MVVMRMIDKYVDEVVRYIPLWRRKAARREIREKLFETLRLYCEGDRPTVRDARAVMHFAGDPRRAAAEYEREHEGERSRRKRKARRRAGRIVHRIEELIFAAAVILLIGGLMSVVLGKSTNPAFFILGAAMAVAVTVVRMVVPQFDTPEEEPESEMAVSADRLSQGRDKRAYGTLRNREGSR